MTEDKLKKLLTNAPKETFENKISQFIVINLKRETKLTFNKIVNLYFSETNFNIFKKTFLKRKIENIIIKLINMGIICLENDEENDIIFCKLTNYSLDLLFNNEDSIDNIDKDKLLSWTYDIGDKQYRSYTWNDTKVQCLLTVDAALIAGLLFVLQLLGNKDISFGILPLVFYGFSFVILIYGLTCCLIHSIPRLNSKLGDGKNIRTIIGIYRYSEIQELLGKNFFYALEKYYKDICKLKEEDLIRMNTDQIGGMAKNNITSSRIIKKSVIATILSIVFLLFGTLLIALYNIPWQQIIQSR